MDSKQYLGSMMLEHTFKSPFGSTRLYIYLINITSKQRQKDLEIFLWPKVLSLQSWDTCTEKAIELINNKIIDKEAKKIDFGKKEYSNQDIEEYLENITFASQM